MGKAGLYAKILAISLISVIAIAGALFIPAGTLDYWQAWLYMAVLFFPASFVIIYFLKNDPEFLERRMSYREKEARQKLVQKASAVVFLIGFILPGLDRRFGWSPVPFEYSIAADAIVFMGYLICFIVFRENSYAGRTIQVERGQKVISTGLYSIIRHPMYLGVLILYLATPIALGSYVAAPVFLLMIPILVFRIRNEEEVLRRELPGYPEYCGKVTCRLVPHVW